MTDEGVGHDRQSGERLEDGGPGGEVREEARRGEGPLVEAKDGCADGEHHKRHC